MGRLTIAAAKRGFRRAVGNRRLRQLLLAWALPLALTLAILFGVHSRVKADPAPSTTELQVFLQDNELSLFDEVSNGVPQVFYFFNHKPIQLTSADFGALHPISSGQYVAYLGIVDGLGQVFLYDVLSNSQIQLSLTAPNEGISMHHNKVAWQSWDGQHWQIYYYDGSFVHQVSSGATDSMNAAINDQTVLYAQDVGGIGADDWKAQEYDMASGQITTVREGSGVTTAYPRFNTDGTISTDFVPY
jgi:hypothetical protein